MKKRNFTLVEVAISASLFAIVGLVIVGTLSNGIKVWQKIYAQDKQQDINIFFEEITEDLRNCFFYESIPFSGNPSEVYFPTFVTTQALNQGLKNGVGRVGYYFNDKDKMIYKVVQNLSNLYKDKISSEDIVLSGVESFEITYYVYDEEAKKYFWTATIEDDNFPIAVNISLTIGYEDKLESTSKTIAFVVNGLIKN